MNEYILKNKQIFGTCCALLVSLILLLLFQLPKRSDNKNNIYSLLEEYTSLNTEDFTKRKQAALTLYHGLQSYPELLSRFGTEVAEHLYILGENKKACHLTKKIIAIYRNEPILTPLVETSLISTKTDTEAVDLLSSTLKESKNKVQDYNLLRLTSYYNHLGDQKMEAHTWHSWKEQGKPLEFQISSGALNLSDFANSRTATHASS